MNNFQTIIYSFLIFTLLAISSSAKTAKDLEDDYYRDERRDALSYLEEFFLEKRTTASTVCSSATTCNDACSSNKTYDNTQSCGLICYSDRSMNNVGDTGICQKSSAMCGDAVSTFCSDGNYTVVGNTDSSYSNYFHCDAGIGCKSGGCCVRNGGRDTGYHQYFCLKCNTQPTS